MKNQKLKILNKQDVELILRKSSEENVTKEVAEMLYDLLDYGNRDLAIEDAKLLHRWLSVSDLENKNEEAIELIDKFINNDTDNNKEVSETQLQKAIKSKELISNFFDKFDENTSQFVLTVSDIDDELSVAVAMNGKSEMIIEAFAKAFHNVPNFRQLLLETFKRLDNDNDNNNNNKKQ